MVTPSVVMGETMDFDLETHLSRVVLGDSAVVLPSTASILSSSRPGTPGGGSSGARPIPGHRRPVSTHTFSSSFNSPPPFPNLLSSLTERAQPLSPTTTIAKTPASRYIRPARCLTDSILSSSSSIDSLLGKSAPRTPPPVTAPPTPAQLVAAPVKIPVSLSGHPVVVAAPAPAPAPAVESALREPVAATSLNAPVEVIEAPINPKQVQNPIPGDSPPSQSAATSERVQKLKSEAIAEIFITTDLKETQNQTQIQTHLTESPASLDIPQSLLPQEPISINTVPPTEPKPVEVSAPPVAEELNTSLSSEPPKKQEIPSSSPAGLASEVQIPAADVLTQVSVPAQLVTPPSTPIRKKPSPAEPSSATPTKTHLPEEGDSFRDFRESPKPLSTPPPSPSAPVSRPSFGKLSSFGTSFSSLVQAVTTAKAASNMGLTGDTRKVSSGHNGFGGWLQKRASIQTISATEGANGKSEEDGSSKSSTLKKPTIDKENAGNGINEGFSASSTSIRSSASSFVEGSSRPTTPQKSPAPNSSLVSPARIATSPLKTIPEPPHPALVDEFQGLSFPMLINSFRTSPSKNVGEPPAEDRLEELANMAQDLLERMYSAYTKRTLALGEVLSDQSILREEVEERKVKARHLQSQLDRMSQEAQTEKEVKDEVITDLMKALENEKMMIEEERRGWEEERDNWRNTEREKIRAELMMEMLAAQGAGELEDGDGDAEMTPKKKRVSSGGASSDSGFDESDKSDTDSFYAMTKVEAAEEKGVSRIARKASSASIVTISTIQSTSMIAGKANNGGERRGKMMPPPLLNPTPLSVMKCESCARMSFTSRPSSPTPSITSFSSPPPSVPGSLNPGRFSTHKNLESPQQSSAPPSANSTITSSRWGWGLRGNNHNNQQELDRLRGENKNLRERVGDLEKSVDDVLGVLGGWRS